MTGRELARARAEQAAAADLLGRAGADVAGCTAALEGAETEAGLLRDRLTAVLGDLAATERPSEVLDRRLAAAAARAARARASVEAVDALSGACDEARRAHGAASEAAVDAGWSDVAAAVACARPRTWREAARRDVDRHERDLHAARLAVTALLHELDEAGVDLPPDDEDLVEAATARAAGVTAEVARLAAELAARETVCRAADGEQARVRAVLDGLRRAVPQLVAAERETGPLRAQADAARALADLCGGANDKGVPLSTYVLAAHLEHVVEAANLRLDGMSDGRYALVHVEQGEDRRRRAGLGLAVIDAWTGSQRPAGTLSGGETFLASLALALGLADVVTAEAGGARIDALFVDEGFGTLDPDSLDRAMDVLDRLQEHGRMVGVVSHVGELRQRLPRQVHVEAGRHGSTVRVLTG